MREALVRIVGDELATDDSVFGSSQTPEGWIARELHDVVAQCLTGLLIELRVMREELAAGSAARLAALEDEVRVGLNGVRELIHLLRGEPIVEENFGAAAEGLLDAFHAKTGIETNLQVSPRWPAEIQAEVSFNLRRILQEALTNIRFHSRAARVDVTLSANDGELALAVADDGPWSADFALEYGQRTGIIGMRERAVVIGADLTIERMPDSGTVVRVTLSGPRPLRIG
jgi:signal transduction histidine kinase